jgi:chemotaxis response regulator CheB
VPETQVADRALARARWELAALAGRLRTLEVERDDWRRRHDVAAAERDRHRDAERALRDSRAYRLGRALIALAGPALRRERPAPAGAAVPEREPVTAPPAHVYIAVGLSADGLRDLTRVLAQRLVVQPGHRPVVVTDCAAFHTARVAGVVLEYLPDPVTWRRHRPDVPWDDLLTERLTRLFTDHGCARTAVVDPGDPPGLADLLA